MFLVMGKPNADRAALLLSMQTAPPGFVWLAVCLACNHRAALPVAAMIARLGPSCRINVALKHMRCTACHAARVDARLLRLCEPGCPHQRG
jgi:hypothetical protein